MSDKNETAETIASGAGIILGGRVVKIGLLFLIEILMARILGSTSYGNVVIATLVMSLAVWVGRLGVPRGITRKLPYYEDDPPKARGVLRAGIVIAVLGGGTTAGTVYYVSPFLAERVFNDPDLILFLRVAAFGVPLGVLTNVGLATAKAQRTAKPRVIVNHLVNPVGQSVLIGLLILAGYGALGAISGRVMAKIATAVVALFLAYRSLRFSLRGTADSMSWETFTFSLPLMFAAGVDFLISNIDTFLIGTFLASSSVGFYNAAFKLRTAGLFFFFPLTYLLPPVLSRMDAEDDLDQARRTYQHVTKWSIFLTTPIFLALFFFPETVISLSFGPQYLDGTTALRILAVPVMFTVLMGANEKALISLGHNRISFYVNVAIAAINIALNIVLIPRIGIVGAALASAVALIFRDVAFTVALYRWERLHPISSATVRPFLAGIVLAAIGYPLLITTVGVRARTIVAAGLLFLVGYVPLTIALGVFGQEDVQLLELTEDRIGQEIPYVRQTVSYIKNRGM